MKRAGLMAVLAIGAGAVLGACGDDGDASRDELVDSLVDQAGVTEEQAECIVDEIGVDDANELANADAEDDVSEDLAMEAIDAMETCTMPDEPAG